MWKISYGTNSDNAAAGMDTITKLALRFGQPTINWLARASYLCGVIAGVFWLAFQPSTWVRTTRDVFSRQLLFTMVDGIPVTIRIGGAVGVLLIVQTAMWTESFGSTMQAVWPIIVRLTLRELGPLIASLVVIGRSAVAIATELSTMRVRGETDVIESQGLDPMAYIVMPRVLATTISTFVLAAIVVASMFVTGYVVGLLVNVINTGPIPYAEAVISAITLGDLVFFLPKTILAGAFIGSICCVEGLFIGGASTDIPRVASRAGVSSLSSVFLISAILSLLIYGRVLVFEVL